MTPAQILIEQATLRGEILKLMKRTIESPLPEMGDSIAVPKQTIEEIRNLFAKLAE